MPEPTFEVSAAHAVIIATQAQHQAELALEAIRGHERLCVERTDRMIESQARSEKQNDEIKNEQGKLHERVSNVKTEIAALGVTIGDKIDRNQTSVVRLVLGGLVMLVGFWVGIAYWLLDHFPALQMHP